MPKVTPVAFRSKLGRRNTKETPEISYEATPADSSWDPVGTVQADQGQEPPSRGSSSSAREEEFLLPGKKSGKKKFFSSNRTAAKRSPLKSLAAGKKKKLSLEDLLPGSSESQASPTQGNKFGKKSQEEGAKLSPREDANKYDESF